MMTLTLGQGGISISSAVRAIYLSLDHVDGTQIHDYLSRYATSSSSNESPNLSKDPSELWLQRFGTAGLFALALSFSSRCTVFRDSHCPIYGKHCIVTIVQCTHRAFEFPRVLACFHSGQGGKKKFTSRLWLFQSSCDVFSLSHRVNMDSTAFLLLSSVFFVFLSRANATTACRTRNWCRADIYTCI